MDVESIINSLSWEKCASWIAEHADPDEDPSSCWNGGAYIRNAFGKPGYQPDLYGTPITLNDLEQLNGIVHFFQQNAYEFHYFTLWMNERTITLRQTYGGVEQLTVMVFAREEWLSLYRAAYSGDVAAYRQCFCIKKPIQTELQRL